MKHGTKRLLPLLLLTTIVGCSSMKPEREFIESSRKAAPLSESVLQAMQPNSIEVLKKADQWYESSGKLLDSVTINSVNSENK